MTPAEAAAGVSTSTVRGARLRPRWVVAGVLAVAAAALAGLVMGPVALSPRV